MSSPLLLDPVGDAFLPAGYQRVGTEAAWLRVAVQLPSTELSPPPVVVAGRDLCAWAERWWQGRGGECQTLRSPTEPLLATCPMLSHAAARTVLNELGPAWTHRPTPWGLSAIIESLYPDFGQPLDPTTGWAAQPTTLPARAALAGAWVLWVSARSENWPAHHRSLLTQQLATWSDAETEFLFPLDTAAAQTLLRVWIGLDQPTPGIPNPALVAGNFPIAIPPRWLAQARALHDHQLTALNDTTLSVEELHQRLAAWWRERNASTIPSALRELAAIQYADFLLAHAQLLHLDHLRELLPVLGSAPVAQQLQNALPPATPANLPADATPAAVLQWVTTQYLPYRRWQSDLLVPQAPAAARVATLAAQFEAWLLATYPALLVGANTGLLHIQQAEELRFARTREVTLWVVPDGLGWLDAAALSDYLHAACAGRLSRPKATACLGLLPTITSLTKKPLLNSTTARALPGAQSNEVRRERYIAGHLNPAEHMHDAQPGDLFIWTPPDPDSAYHGTFDRRTIQQRVAHLLQVIAQQLAAAAQAVPASLAFRLVVSTDHGRQLGTSARTVAIPPGFESHGRAAYPATNSQLVPSAADQARPDLAWLEPEAFGLPYWAATVRGEDSFRTNNTDAGGNLHFPHGGLWPEEVVVPWLVAERSAPAVSFKPFLSGHGLARRRGELKITLTNPSSQSYELLLLTLTGPDNFTASLPLSGQRVPSTAMYTHSLPLESWPTPSQAAQLKAHLQLIDTQGQPAEAANFVVQLTSEDFEESPDLDLNF